MIRGCTIARVAINRNPSNRDEGKPRASRVLERARVLVTFSASFPALRGVYLVERVAVFCWLTCAASSFSLCFFLAVSVLKKFASVVAKDSALCFSDRGRSFGRGRKFLFRFFSRAIGFPVASHPSTAASTA